MIAKKIKELITMGKETTNKIHEFYPLIYPFKLWVVINPKLDDVKDRFYTYDTNDNLHDFDNTCFMNVGDIAMTCYPVCEKNSWWKGIVLFIRDKKAVDVGGIAHESSHIVDYMCDRFGIKGFTFDDGEARAYLVGWAANCIDSVIKGKVK